MTAFIRSFQTSTIETPAGSATRGDARPGDILIAFQSADSGGYSSMFLEGDWQFLASVSNLPWPGSVNGTWAGLRILQRICTASEPAVYGTFQGPVADGVVTIMAIAGAAADSLQISVSGDTTAPTLTPTAASGLNVRYATGAPSPPPGTRSWSVPAGYAELADVQSGQFTSAALAWRPVVSTSPLGDVTFTPSGTVAAAACTISVDSAEIPVPDPPITQPFAPGRGSSRFRYVFTRLRDRTYLGDLDLVGVRFDKRLLQPGSFSATIPIPNRRIGDQVAEIIGRDETELGVGPGVITCQIYREAEPWGEYWITGAQPSRSRRGTPSIQLRGSTLDAYLSRVEIQEDLFYSVDQVQIARNLLSHLSGQPNANISLNLQTGTSGVERDRAYLASERGTYGQRLVELAQVDGGFEWVIDLALVDGVLQRQWRWGYPQLGVQDPPQHLFSDGRSGGDILEWSEEVDALRGATRWRAQGSTSGADASTASVPLMSTPHEATAHLAAGWPRIDRTLSYSTVSEVQTLEDYAAFWASRAAGALRVDTVTVTFGTNPSFSPNHLGDAARIYLDNPWHRGVWRTRRVIGIEVTPPSRQDGKEEAKLVLEGTEVPGA